MILQKLCLDRIYLNRIRHTAFFIYGVLVTACRFVADALMTLKICGVTAARSIAQVDRIMQTSSLDPRYGNRAIYSTEARPYLAAKRRDAGCRDRLLGTHVWAFPSSRKWLRLRRYFHDFSPLTANPPRNPVVKIPECSDLFLLILFFSLSQTESRPVHDERRRSLTCNEFSGFKSRSLWEAP